MMPFQMTRKPMTLTLTFTLKIAFSDYCRLGHSASQTYLDFCLLVNLYQHNEMHTDGKI